MVQTPLPLRGGNGSRTIAFPPEPIWRFTLEQYHAMVRSQVLTEANALEFLDGFLVPKMVKKPAHRISTRLVRQILEQWIPAGYYVDSQEPITLGGSEPEPDVAVILGKTTDYRDRHPGAAEVLLVVEVAEATLERDRGLKKRLYAAEGIADYWILNLVDRQLECYSDPQVAPDLAPEGVEQMGVVYQRCEVLGESASLSFPWVLDPGVSLPTVGDLL